MKSSKVYYTRNKLNGAKIFDALKIDFLKEGLFCAIKIHFGEHGNTAYLKPAIVKPIIDKIIRSKSFCFLTDANTLYKGTRSDAVNHIKTANEHGYNMAELGVPVIIADGLNGKESITIKVGQKHLKEVKIGAAAYHADNIIVLTHFKGHELTGFGGSLKNVGMGFGSRAGKQIMHADVKPHVNEEKCTRCGCCVKWCPTSAITLLDGKKASIDLKKCIGCGECIASCSFGAIAISWEGTPASVQEKIVEYFYGVWKDKIGKMAFFNFLTDISPNCDCYAWNDKPVTKDIGILASFDPVAIDQASIDLVNKAAGNDVFKVIYPTVDWSVQLSYAESIKIGTRKYDLIEI